MARRQEHDQPIPKGAKEIEIGIEGSVRVLHQWKSCAKFDAAAQAAFTVNFTANFVGPRKLPCLLLAALIFFSGSCFGLGVDDDDEQAELAKLPPDQLARRACSLCHLYPEPSMLTRKNWREQILPRMSVELGIFPPTTPARPKAKSCAPGGSTRMCRGYRKSFGPRLSNSIFKRARISPCRKPDHPPIELGLKLFKASRRVFRQPPTTSLVKISPSTHRIYVGDDHSKKLNILDQTASCSAPSTSAIFPSMWSSPSAGST